MTSNYNDDGPYRDQKWPDTKIECNVRLFLVRELQELDAHALTLDQKS